MSGQWTIDSIAHALPHSETRQSFLREINTVPVGDLPATLERWIAVARQWVAEGPRLEDVAARFRESGVVPDGLDVTDEVTAGARSRGAA